MNNLAPEIHLTGQPRWAQLTEKAVNFSLSSLLSQAAVIAVTPAQGSGEGSSYETFTVSPMLKSLICPTCLQIGSGFLNIGASIDPITGIPTIAAAMLPSVMQSLVKNSLRLHSFVFMLPLLSEISYPTYECNCEQNQSHKRDYYYCAYHLIEPNCQAP